MKAMKENNFIELRMLNAYIGLFVMHVLPKLKCRLLIKEKMDKNLSSKMLMSMWLKTNVIWEDILDFFSLELIKINILYLYL